MTTAYFTAPATPSERIIAAFAHGGTVFAWFLAPLVVYLLTRRESPRVARHAREALLWSAVGTLLGLVTFGLALPVFMVFHLLAAWRVYHGEPARYPILSGMLRAE